MPDEHVLSAADLGASLIVVGAKGHLGLRRLRPGRVAELERQLGRATSARA